MKRYSPHHPSSDPSGQSGLPSQKNSLARHVPSAQPNSFLFLQPAASKRGFGAFHSTKTSQLSTFALKSQICRFTSKRSPSEHLNSKTSPSGKQETRFFILQLPASLTRLQVNITPYLNRDNIWRIHWPPKLF